VAAADHRLAAEATKVRDRYARAVRTLSATERRKQDAVEQLDTQRTQIGQLLAQRKSLLSSIQSEVATLKVEEARRQARLEAEAKARLAAEAAARKKAEDEAKARAAELAAAAAKKPKTTPKAPPAASPPATTTVSTSTTTTTSTPPPVQTVPSGPISGGHPEAATIALRYLGVPYQWGGATPAGFDCSGLVMYVYAQLGIQLPHYAAAQYGLGSPVARDQLQPGDLVFFDNLDHVAIYIGGGQVVHAPSTGDVVKISNISDWGSGYVGARRI
jgi:cell wall-associated NlpC family hydrolase